MSDHNKISPAIFFSLAPSTSSPFDQSKKKHTNTKNSCQNNCFSQSSSKSKLFSGNGRTTSSTLHTLQFCCGNAKILKSKSELFHSNLRIYKKKSTAKLTKWQIGRDPGPGGLDPEYCSENTEPFLHVVRDTYCVFITFCTKIIINGQKLFSTVFDERDSAAEKLI